MPIRLNDEQFERIITASGNPTEVERIKPIVAKFNDEEKGYLRQLIEGKKRGEQSYTSVKRLRAINEGRDTSAAPPTQQTPPTPDTRGFVTRHFAPLRERQREAGTSPLVMPPFQEEEARDLLLGMFGEDVANNPNVRDATQIGMNIPGSAASAVGGLVDFAKRGVGVAGKMAKTFTVGGNQPEALGDLGDFLKEDVGGLVYNMVGVPASYVNALLWEATPMSHTRWGQWLGSKGINSEMWNNYVKHDPVGTFLYLWPGVRGAAKLAEPKALKAPKPPTQPLREVASQLAEQKQKISEQKANAPVAFDNLFIDTKRGVPEAVYKLTEDIVDFGERGTVKAGETVLASELTEAGYKVEGPVFERRAPGRPTDVTYHELLTERINQAFQEHPEINPIQNPEKFYSLMDEYERALKSSFKEKDKAYHAKLSKEARALGIEIGAEPNAETIARARRAGAGALTGKDVTNETLINQYRSRIEEAYKQVLDERTEARYRELLNRRQPGEAITIDEAIQAIKNFSPSYTAAKEALMKRAYPAAGSVLEAERTALTALYEEAQLARPDLTRKQIKRLNDMYARSRDNYVGRDVEWLVEQIAVARALRGQATTPITTPHGNFPASRLPFYRAAAERLNAHYADEIAKGDNPITRLAGSELGQLSPELAAERVTRAPELGGHIMDDPATLKVLEARKERARTEAQVDLDLELAGKEAPPLDISWPKAKPKRDRAVPQPPDFETLTEADARTNSSGPSPSANAAAQTAAYNGAVRSSLSRFMGTTTAGASVTNVIGQLQASLRNLRNAFAPSTRTVASMNKPLGDFFNRKASADGYVTTITEVEMLNAEKAIKQAMPGISDKLLKEKMKFFARKLNSEGAKAAEARNISELAEMQSIIQALPAIKLGSRHMYRKYVKRYNELKDLYRPQVNVPKFTHAEEALFSQDPTMAALSKWWLSEMQPLIESYADPAGIDSALYGPDGFYAKINYDVDPTTAPAGAKVVSIDPQGGSNTLGARATKRAAARRRRTAHMPTGMVIVDDLKHILNSTLKDRVGKAADNELISALMKEDLTGVVPRGGKVTINGKTHRVVSSAVLENNVRKHLLLPEPYAKAYDHVTAIPHEQLPIIGMVVRLTVGSALLIPAEATMHALNVAFAAMDMGGKYPYSRTIPRGGQFLVDHTLPGRAIGLMYNMWNQTGKDFEHLVVRMSKAGALRTSGYKHTGLTTAAKGAVSHAMKGELGKTIESAAALSHETPGLSNIRDSVFGLPNFNKNGLKGIETRARAAMWRAIEAGDPTLSDAQIANTINDRVGTYVKAMEPQWVRKSLFIDPFARAGTAAIKTSVKSTAEAALAPWRNHRNSVMLYSTIGAYFLITRSLTGGKWPWEIPNLKPGDIPIPVGEDRNGNQQYRHIPFRTWYNTPYRAMQMTGLRNVAESYIRGERSVDALADEWMRGLGNAVMSRVGPPGKAAFSSMTGGKAMYMQRGGEFMRINPQHMPGAGKFYNERIKPAAQVAVPLWHKWDESMEQPTTPEPASPLWRYIELAGKTLGIEAPLHTPERELAAAGSVASSRLRLLKGIVRSVAYELSNVPPEERNLYILEQFKSRLATDQERQRAYMELMRIMGGLPRRYTTQMLDKMLTEQYSEGNVETPILPQQP